MRKVIIRHSQWEEQLRQLAAELSLRPDPALLFSRCADCNMPLETLTREEAVPLVPPMVRTLDTPFWCCRRCGWLYWNGTHTERIVEKLRALGLR